MKTFGQKYKELRLKRGFSLREFCRINGLDPSNLSKMERDVLPPPPIVLLHNYLEYINVEQGTDLWFEMIDLAAISCGRIPHYILSDKKLAEKMPIFFKVVRNSEKLNGKDVVDTLKGIIKDAWTA